jgi:hypothetical protein
MKTFPSQKSRRSRLTFVRLAANAATPAMYSSRCVRHPKVRGPDRNCGCLHQPFEDYTKWRPPHGAFEFGAHRTAAIASLLSEVLRTLATGSAEWEGSKGAHMVAQATAGMPSVATRSVWHDRA